MWPFQKYVLHTAHFFVRSPTNSFFAITKVAGYLSPFFLFTSRVGKNEDWQLAIGNKYYFTI